MERQLWQAIVALLASLDKPRTSVRCRFQHEDIVLVYYWAVLHDGPACWACRAAHWPPHLRKRPLPSGATLSRRLRTAPVRALLATLERRAAGPGLPGPFWAIDAKPLPVGGCTKDRQARYGRAAGGKAKGYKLHAVVGTRGQVAAWRLFPMNAAEQAVALRLVRALGPTVVGYLAADLGYDSNRLYEECRARGDLLLVVRRRGTAPGPATGRGLGHRRQSPLRLAALERLEGPAPAFAERLLADRNAIEQYFGGLASWGGGLTGLPPWVRTHPRVHRWVQAKLALTALRRQLRTGVPTTYAA